MRPPSTSRRLTSAMRAKNGVALAASGTTAAQAPIVVPTRSRVIGRSATSRMMKGVARKPFTIAASARCRVGARIRPPGDARTRNKASGMPSATAMATDAPTMASVSRKAAQSRSTICGDITEYPRPIRDARELIRRPAGAPPGRPPTAGRTHGPECDPASSATAGRVRRTPWLWPKGPAQDRSCQCRSARPMRSSRPIPAAA